MAFAQDKAEELLNAISLDLVLISTDNLVEISDVLGKVERLSEIFASLGDDCPARIINVLEDSLKAVIRGQIEDADQAMALIGEGLSMLQELARSLPVGVPFKGDVPALAASIGALITSGGLVPNEVPRFDLPPSPAPDPKPPLRSTSEGRPAASSEIRLPGRPEAPGPEAEDEAQTPSEAVADRDYDQLPQADYFRAEDSTAGPLSVEAFKKEFIPGVEEIQVMLVAIEQKSDPRAALNSLSRNFKAVLTAASLLHLEDMALLAYESTDLIEYVASDHIPYSTAITDILLRVCGYLLKSLEGLKLTGGGRGWQVDSRVYDRREFESFIDELWMARQGFLPSAPEIEENQPAGSAQALKPKKIGEILVEKGLISEGDLGGLIEAQQNARKIPLGHILLAGNHISQKDLDEALEEQKKTPDKKLGEILVAQGKLDYEQIDAAVRSQEEKRKTKLGEFLVKSKIGAPEKVAIALREQKQSEGIGKIGPIMSQTVKVETMKLDGLIDLVGELVIAQSLITSNEAVTGLKEQKINKDLAQVSRITSELQRNAMSLRMVPIQQTFQKMNRLVRDLANKFEKDVKFETLGNDTEIDRNMVENIYDPLVHLMRNTLDHGLETPAERRAAGKSPQGQVRLKAYHQGGSVVIELSDDGRGLDRGKVLKKALEQGLAQTGENLSEAAIHALIFQPGFSTAEKVSDVSGRGVGMDVVKKSIEKLRGKVDFSSVPGRGSTTTIRLPLTLAIIDGMIVRVGLHRYILPTMSILESFRPVPSDYFTVKNQGEMIKVRKHLVPLVRLDRIVGADGAVTNPEEALVVVVENEGEYRCLLVDEVLGKQEVVIKSLGERLKYVRALAGGTILGDGRVGLILDVAGLFEMSGMSGMSGSLAAYNEFEAESSEDWGMDDRPS